MPIMYEVPPEYYFRMHHIRPRFKNDVESVLVYVATEISKLPKMGKDDFMERVNQAIRMYPGNATKTDKTINNWRTEISSLFGFIEYDSMKGLCWPSKMAKHLAEHQDLVEFFKYFLYYFQYPGAHLKSHEILKFINEGIRFKPAQYIINLLSAGEKITGRRFGITKAETTHCVFNDLRVTRDNRSPEEVARLILDNRENRIRYDESGDVIRYAGDILDYMVLADLLTVHGGMYYLNEYDKQSIHAFIHNVPRFTSYDPLYNTPGITTDDINRYYDEWFHYVNSRIDTEIFRTDIFRYLGIDRYKYDELERLYANRFAQILEEGETRTKDIGDFGEHLAHGHECMRVKLGGREDLIRLIKLIPNSFAAGFDIQSVELDGTKRYIEVKSTISMGSINFNKFQMTVNEWKTAESLDGRYYVYRLMISKDKRKLFIIQDPVGKYKKDDGSVRMTPGETIEITFTDKAGKWEELLIWES